MSAVMLLSLFFPHNNAFAAICFGGGYCGVDDTNIQPTNCKTTTSGTAYNGYCIYSCNTCDPGYKIVSTTTTKPGCTATYNDCTLDSGSGDIEDLLSCGFGQYPNATNTACLNCPDPGAPNCTVSSPRKTTSITDCYVTATGNCRLTDNTGTYRSGDGSKCNYVRTIGEFEPK